MEFGRVGPRLRRLDLRGSLISSPPLPTRAQATERKDVTASVRRDVARIRAEVGPGGSHIRANTLLSTRRKTLPMNYVLSVAEKAEMEARDAERKAIVERENRLRDAELAAQARRIAEAEVEEEATQEEERAEAWMRRAEERAEAWTRHEEEIRRALCGEGGEGGEAGGPAGIVVIQGNI